MLTRDRYLGIIRWYATEENLLEKPVDRSHVDLLKRVARPIRSSKRLGALCSGYTLLQSKGFSSRGWQGDLLANGQHSGVTAVTPGQDRRFLILRDGFHRKR